MSLKTVSLISLIIVTLVFIYSFINACNYLTYDSEYNDIEGKIFLIINSLSWLPFMLFFWKIYKG